MTFACLLAWAVWQFLVLNPYLGVFGGILANPHLVLAVHLALVLVAGYVLLQEHRWEAFPNIALIAAGIVPLGAIFLMRGQDIFLRQEALSALDMAGIGVTLLAVAELLRRMAGWRYAAVFLAAVIAYLAHSTRASSLPGESVEGLGMAVWRLLFSPDGLFSINLLLVATILFPLALFGEILSACGLERTAQKVAQAVFGRSREGDIKSTVASAAMIGAFRMDSPGIALSPEGAPRIPGVRRAAAAYSHLMPPALGIMAWLLTEFTSATPLDVVAWCILPALLGFVALFYAVHLDHQRVIASARAQRFSTVFAPLLVIIGVSFALCFGLLAVAAAFDLRSERMGGWALAVFALIYVAWALVAARLGPLEPEYGARPLALLLLREGYLALPVAVLAWGVIFARIPLQLAVLWGALSALVVLLTLHPARRVFAGDADVRDYPAYVYGHLFHALARATRLVVYVTLMIVTALPMVLLAKDLALDQHVGALLETSLQTGLVWLPALALLSLGALAVALGIPYIAFFLVLAQIVLALGDALPPDGYSLIGLLFTVLLASLAVQFYASSWRSGRAWRLGVPLLLLPFLALTEPLFMEYLGGGATAIFSWIIRMVLGMLLVVAAVQGYFLAKASRLERAILALAGLCCLFPQEVLRVVYPSYTVAAPERIFEIAAATPADAPLVIRLRGESAVGETVEFRASLPLPEGADGGDRLKKAGLTLRKEGKAFKVDEIAFESAAEQAGIDFDNEVIGVERVREQPRRRWVVLLALLAPLAIGLRSRLRSRA